MCKVLWWPVDWKTHQTSGTSKNDVLKMIAAIYLQFDNRVLELHPGLSLTPVVPPLETEPASVLSSQSISENTVDIEGDIDVVTVDVQVHSAQPRKSYTWLNEGPQSDQSAL